MLAFIDWTPFFIAWEMPGVYPKILRDPSVGVEARKLYEDGKALLAKIIAEQRFTARGVIGLWPARRVGDDITLPEQHTAFHTLRQQRDQSVPNAALADFVSESPDWIGGFAVGIHGADELASEYAAAHDDYNSIMVKALADRLAEAFAEKLHQDVRRQYWGYAQGETLSGDDLIKERYRGIRRRPAIRPSRTTPRSAPCLPCSTPESIGMQLTESCAMLPAAAVSGLYLAHPDSKYLALGRIGRDQVADYAPPQRLDAGRWLKNGSRPTWPTIRSRQRRPKRRKR